MIWYKVKLPVAGFIELEIQADSNEEAINNAFKAFTLADEAEIEAYRSLDEYFVTTENHTPFTKVTVTQLKPGESQREIYMEWKRKIDEKSKENSQGR